MKLNQEFYRQDTLKVAQELLGKFLVRKIDGKIYQAQIIETEAYKGFEDKASHASKGKTPRNSLMFGPPGYCYVYLIYGMYHCLNFVTEEEGYPAAVLIRTLNYQNANGPGKLCREFKITKENTNGLILMEDIIWVEDRGVKVEFEKLSRVGVDYAGECKNWPWRFKAKVDKT